jgi:hypothetical protein
MKNTVPLLILLLLVVLPAVAFTEAPQRALVVVDDPTSGTAAALLDSGIPVVRDMGRYLLVAAEAADLGRLAGISPRWRILDSSMGAKTYYTVTLRDEAQIAGLRTLARVLAADRYDAVVEASEADAAAIVAAGYDVARVFIRPVRLPRDASEATSTAAKVADPIIQGMVGAVNGTNVDANVQRLQNFVTRYCTTDSAQAAANWIQSKFLSFGITDVQFEAIPGGYKPNVVATIPGTGDPTKIIVLGAHYDSYAQTNNAPGADDNASGTSCVIETARILSQYEFNYTIKFVAFGAEELGLYGSEAFAANSAARGDDILAAVCVDMIGYLAGGDVLDLDIIRNTSSQWIQTLAFQCATDYVPGFATVNGTIPGGASSDHASFWAHGYDSILFFEDSGSYSPYIHTTSDVVGTSYNSPTLARNSVKTAVGLVATLAQPFVIGITHTPLADTGDSVNPYRVAATITAAGTLNPDSLLVRYDTGSGFQAVQMTPTGTADEYEALIPAQAPGTFVDYYIVAEDTNANRRTDPVNAPATVHSFFVGTLSVILADDFESAGSWTVGAAGDNATTGVWQRGDPQGTTTGTAQVQPEDDHTGAPGINCYATQLAAGTSVGQYDVDNGKTTLLSPVFDLSSYTVAFVSYWRWYTNSLGSGAGDDYWQVQVTNNGTTWVDLEYTLENRNSWAQYSFQLHQYITLTANVRFRFIASDVNLASLVEAAVDDFSITGFEPVISVEEGGADAPRRVILAESRPNPFNPRTEIRYFVPAPGQKVTLRIYDVSGRKVRSLLQGERVSGWSATAWNGNDEGGAPAASGVYFCRLEAGNKVLSRRLVLIR